MKQAVNWFSNRWLKIIGYGLAGVAVMGLLFFDIHRLLPKYALVEQTAVANSSLVDKVTKDPLYAPHKVMQWTLQRAGLHGPLAMRGVSALFGLISVALFFYLLNLWHTERIAVFGTALFVMSSWFLHTARLATPDIIATAFTLALIALAYFCSYAGRRGTAILFVLGLVIAGALYIPGMLWLVIAILIWKSGSIMQLTKRVKLRHFFAVGMMIAVLLLPLAYALARDVDLLKQWLLIPEVIPTVPDFINQILHVPSSLFIAADINPALGLHNLPLLDAFSGIMFLLGIYYWERQLSVKKLIVAVVVGILGVAVLALANERQIISMLLLPFVYLIIAGGITVLLQQWFTVFPRNPLARMIGLGMMTLVIGLAGMYHLTRYYVAWPNTPETKETFVLEPPDSKWFWQK